MDPQRRRLNLQLIVPLALPPADNDDYERFLVQALFLCRIPPDETLDIRNRLFCRQMYTGRDVFEMFAQHRYTFFMMTGESPATFIALIENLEIPNNHMLSKRNRFLIIFMWLRNYPCHSVLSALFDVSETTINSELKLLLPILDDALDQFLVWPSIRVWESFRGVWPKLNLAVGAIDGTSHEIYMPIDNQQQYYSGHRHYHCLHTQIVVDCDGMIRYVETGFLGHQNDAQQFMLMRQIGGDQLPFPEQCMLLADKIYPNRHPVMTPFSAAQIRLMRGDERRRALRFNRYLSSYRVRVEHAIAELKTYRCVSSVWRHPRQHLSRTVRICAKLVCRRKDIGLIL